MRFDLPQKRHWRMLSGYCDTGKMAFENLPLGVSSHVYTACTLNAVGCTRTHLSLVLNGKRNFTEWMSSRCLDAIQFDTEEAQELV